MICLGNGSDAKKRRLFGAVQERKEGREGREEGRTSTCGEQLWLKTN